MSLQTLPDIGIREMLENLDYIDLVYLKRTEKAIRDLLEQRPYREIFERKRLELYDQINHGGSRAERLKGIYQLDPALLKLSRPYDRICREGRLPQVVSEPISGSVTIRGIHWIAPVGSDLVVDAMQDRKSGVDYPCLVNTRRRRRLF